MNLNHLFDRSFRSRPNQVALEVEGGAFTFAQMDDRANRMAALLQARGLVCGDRLCVYLSNCLEYVDLYLACVRLGVILVPINVLYREREIQHILADAEPKAVVAREPTPGSVPL